MELTRAEIEALKLQLGSLSAVARHIGCAESTLRWKLQSGKFVRVSPAIKRVSELETEVAALRGKLAEPRENKPRVVPGKAAATRILAIGDTHDQPGMSKDRFRWIGRHAAEWKPDRIIQIGDFASWDSVSAHDQPGTVNHAQRPTFRADLDSCEEAMGVFLREIDALECPLDLIAGNHEDRIQRFENKTPETVGTLWAQFEETAMRYRWRVHPYGHWFFVDGVGFTHVPHNIMGRPYGGQNSENQIANHATHSIVFGHTHRATFRKVPKIGINNSIEVLNLGSAMPHGYVARYAGTATSGWSYGIYELHVHRGHIVDHRFISMQALEELYG